jgi:hypothetical protein
MKTNQLSEKAEATSRFVAAVEQQRLQEMRAKSERVRKLREERDVLAADK